MLVKIFLEYAFMFFIGSCTGWIIELLFRRFISSKKWINPGFLVGPCLPLYGFGLCGLYTISNINLAFLKNNSIIELIVIITFMTVLMTLIEYIAGLIFIKGMNLRLWDYSKRWGNIEGIICPLFSLIWGAIGTFFYFFINPYIKNCLNWLINHISFSFVIGMFYGILIIDLFYSFDLANKFKKFAKENKIIIHYEKFKESIKTKTDELKIKTKFFLQFKNTLSIKEQLMNYLEHLKEKKK